MKKTCLEFVRSIAFGADIPLPDMVFLFFANHYQVTSKRPLDHAPEGISDGAFGLTAVQPDHFSQTSTIVACWYTSLGHCSLVNTAFVLTVLRSKSYRYQLSRSEGPWTYRTPLDVVALCWNDDRRLLPKS